MDTDKWAQLETGTRLLRRVPPRIVASNYDAQVDHLLNPLVTAQNAHRYYLGLMLDHDPYAIHGHENRRMAPAIERAADEARYR